MVISAILLFLLILYFGFRIHENQTQGALLHSQMLENTVPTVSIIHAQKSPAVVPIALPGTIQSWFQAPIYAQVSGYVKMWYKDYGASVKKGDILAKINAPALDAQYHQARADLVSERAKYALAVVTAERYLKLRDTHAVSKQSISVKVQEMRAEKALVKAVRQKLRNLEALIRFKTIRAPYDGVVIERNINVGDYVNKEGNISGQKKTNLFTVAKLGKMRVFVSVPASYGPYLNPSITADVTVPQFPHRHYTATFLNVARGFDPRTRTAVTQFILPNEDHSIWPGSYARVHLKARVKEGVLVIPFIAQVFNEKGTQVAVVGDDDRLHFKPITVSAILASTLEVTEGISLTDRIVSGPNAMLLEGEKVRVVDPSPGFDFTYTKKKEVASAEKAGQDGESSNAYEDLTVSKTLASKDASVQ